MGKYRITAHDMAPGTRVFGVVLRWLMPYSTMDTFLWQNKMLDRYIKGHWLTRKTKVRAEYIPRSDGTLLRVLICTSRHNPTKPQATGLLWMHGGGFAIGLPEQDFLFVNEFVPDGSCVAVMPDYRRSVDAPYPAALEDCVLALSWMAEHAEALGINPRQLFIGGDSAGGGLTAALSLYARDHGGPDIAFQLPLYPMLDDREITPSSQNNDAPCWCTVSNHNAWEIYLAGNAGPDVDVSPYAAPARAENLAGLPPTLTFTGTIEPFLDETRIYCERLEEAGVKVFYRTFERCFHGFDMLAYPSKPSREARQFTQEGFHWAQEHCFTS